MGDPSGLVAEFLAFYEHDALTHTTAFAGSAAVLAALAEAGHRLALCTNKPQAPTEAVLATLGLAGHFRAVLGGDALPFHKPDPRHLLASIAAAGGRRDRAVLVGDSPIDAQAGQAAGVPVILVRHGYSRQPLEELGADAIIDDLTGLLAILAP